MNLPKNTRLEIKRVIKASPARVYAAWTDPEQMKEWLGPEGTRTRRIVVDPRVGGEFCWEVTGSDGEEMTARGNYRELIPGKKVVFTWRWDDDEAWENNNSVVTVELNSVRDGTEVRLVHELLPSEESRDRHCEGWTEILGSLEQYLDKQQKE